MTNVCGLHTYTFETPRHAKKRILIWGGGGKKSLKKDSNPWILIDKMTNQKNIVSKKKHWTYVLGWISNELTEKHLAQDRWTASFFTIFIWLCKNTWKYARACNSAVFQVPITRQVVWPQPHSMRALLSSAPVQKGIHIHQRKRGEVKGMQRSVFWVISFRSWRFVVKECGVYFRYEFLHLLHGQVHIQIQWYPAKLSRYIRGLTQRLSGALHHLRYSTNIRNISQNNIEKCWKTRCTKTKIFVCLNKVHSRQKCQIFEF